MKPPLFIWESDDLTAFESVAALEAFVEPPDVDAGRAFDATGMPAAARKAMWKV
jgi:hypothetical protein